MTQKESFTINGSTFSFYLRTLPLLKVDFAALGEYVKKAWLCAVMFEADLKNVRNYLGGNRDQQLTVLQSRVEHALLTTMQIQMKLDKALTALRSTVNEISFRAGKAGEAEQIEMRDDIKQIHALCELILGPLREIEKQVDILKEADEALNDLA